MKRWDLTPNPLPNPMIIRVLKFHIKPFLKNFKVFKKFQVFKLRRRRLRRMLALWTYILLMLPLRS